MGSGYEMKLNNETKVGLFVGSTLILIGFFAWLLGASNPFKQTVDLFVTYNFAGGIEVGSPVRVAGIKVGKVRSIEFFTPENVPQNVNEKNSDKKMVLTPVRLKISIDRKAAEGVREDSKFYINMAGIIGERYVEITPGTYGSPKLLANQTLRGIDPPRIDQLISQSFNLAGKVKEMLDNNEGDITKSIKLIYELSANINKTVSGLEKSNVFKKDAGELVENLIKITGDLKIMTSKVNTEEGKQTMELLYKLLWRLEPLDQQAIHRFFQQEGLKTRLF